MEEDGEEEGLFHEEEPLTILIFVLLVWSNRSVGVRRMPVHLDCCQ